MIYQPNRQTPTMSSARKTSSPRPQRRSLQASSGKCVNAKAKRATDRTGNEDRCRGRCRVQWSEKHVKEGLVLVQEAQLARVVKTSPISEHYEIDPKPFANGQWAKVYRCRSRSTGILYAAKYSSRSRFNADCSAELRHEIALLSLCSQSPRVVRLHDVFETPKEIILVMEYAPGGDLQTLIDGDLVPLEGDVVHFVRQLVEGLAYLHERNIAHLDIKPQNLVMMGSFPECEVKLCDFEISRVVLEGTEVREILGTPDYVAPEILHYEPITLAADMWSLGVTTYVLLTGFSPFGGETDQETFQNISLGEVDFPEELFGDISTQAKDFVAKLLVLDPSARMTAKQCLRHDWLRAAPMQASPHLRRYLSKSREILLERVVSRENLRRAALLSEQASSQANLSSDAQESNHHRDQSLQDCLLSQSEMCLSHRLTGSRSSLEGSEGFPSPAESRASLCSSRTNLSCASQSCLLNKEQTQGLLSRAQSRSQANLDHGPNRGLLSRIRSLNRIQSQACLLNGSPSVTSNSLQTRMIINPVSSHSREKLYGLRSLSKSQGVLDIYRSLECLRRRRKSYQRAKTEDMLPIFKRLGVEIDTSNSSNTSDASIATTCGVNDIPSLGNHDTSFTEPRMHADNNDSEIAADLSASVPSAVANDRKVIAGEKTSPIVESTRNNSNESGERGFESEENLDSLKSIESDTLTEGSDEHPIIGKTEPNLLDGRRPCQRHHSDASSRSNNSTTSEDKEDRSTESENEEPKYTVAQLVSAFNKHQEVASKTSLEAIMTEKRINEVTFPTGTKALRLFIPDIDITETKIVRRKTSYKPRKNWEELRKKDEKNEGILKSFDRDSGNEDDDDDDDDDDEDEDDDDDDDDEEDNDVPEKTKNESNAIASHTVSSNENKSVIRITTERNDKKDVEPSREQWSMLPPIEVNGDSIFTENMDVRDNVDTRIDEKYKRCVKGAKMNMTETTEKLEGTSATDRSFVASSACQKDRLPNYIYSDVTCHGSKGASQEATKKTSSVISNGKNNRKSPKAVQPRPTYNAECANVNLKDILQRVDSFQNTPKENLENLRKRTSIAKIILNDNLPQDSQEIQGGNPFRARSEPPASLCRKEENNKMKLEVPPSIVRSSSMSSDSSCPTPGSMRSEVNVSWEDVQGAPTSNISSEKEDSVGKLRKKGDLQRTSSEGKNKQSVEDKRLWGRVCTGSYSRAMEKFSKNSDVNKKTIGQSNGSQLNEKTRRRSSPAMPRCVSP